MVDGTHRRASTIALVNTRFFEYGSEINHCVLLVGNPAFPPGTGHNDIGASTIARRSE